jgi:probable O-glycosylation ligase (exosortase A-associated)
MLRTLFVLGIALYGGAYALRAPFYTLLLYLWIAYFRPETWVWGGFVQTLPLSLYTGILLVFYSIAAGPGFVVTPRIALLLAVLVQSLASALLSDYSTWAFLYWRDFAKTLIITYLIPCLVRTPAQFRLTLIIIALSLGLEVVKQGWAQMILNPGGANMNDHPVLGDNNGVALGVLMLVPFVVALSETAKTKWEKRAYLFFIVGAVYRAISTYSRGAFISSGVLLAMSFARSQHKLRTSIAIVTLVVLIVPILPQEFWDRMGTIALSEEELQEDDTSSRGRLHFWRVATQMAAAHPIVGIGHNAFTQAYDAYDFSRGTYGRGRAVHSSWFGVLAELGYLGFCLFTLVMVTATVSAMRVRRAAKRGEVSAELGAYAAALEKSFLVFAVGGTFLSMHYVEFLWHYVGLSIALTAIAERSRHEVAETVESPTAPATVPAIHIPRRLAEPAESGVRLTGS